jgi:SH3-like domain-containing protein
MAERAEKVMPPEPASPPGNTVVTPRMDYPQGIITVPSVGLRVNHSMESRTLGHVVVKNGERVFIVKKFSPQVGPTWMQIRTKSGKVGWVFASLVRERKGRV